VLTIEDLNVHYGTTHAVRGVTLSVSKREAVALLGPNGAGKTSTLRAISGLVSSTGTIQVDGQDLRALTVESIARRGIVHVPEGRRVFRDLTVEENLKVGATASVGRTAGFSIADVYDLFPALVALRHRLGYALSGGEQQMVALGRALVGAPNLLLVDEPSLGLAPKIVDAVASALLEIRSRTAILVVEQNVRLALHVCSRAAVMREGTIVLEGPADQLRNQDALLASYLGEREIGSAT
jgi:branched-chain amino acid transport system ATP-binding protein